MAGDNATDNSSRTGDLVETVFALHDRLTNTDEELQAYEDVTDRNIREIRASIVELRRLILLFGVIVLVCVVVIMWTAFTVLTTKG